MSHPLLVGGEVDTAVNGGEPSLSVSFFFLEEHLLSFIRFVMNGDWDRPCSCSRRLSSLANARPGPAADTAPPAATSSASRQHKHDISWLIAVS